MFKKVILLILFIISISLQAQDKIQENLNHFSENFPQEKIHALFDKKSYVAGETMHFKCFIFNGYVPSQISTSLFVELYDKNKKLLDKKMFPLFQGGGFGSINLSDSLQEGVYFFRAYTTWMTNFSEDFQLLKPILVYNPKSIEKLTLRKDEPWFVTLHPEGGNLFNNIESKISVRMHSKGVLPEKWSGEIVEKTQGTLITNFNSFDENIGLFSIIPEHGKNYELVIKDNNGKIKKFDLPLAINQGIAFKVVSKNNLIEYSLASSEKNLTSTFYKVVGQINNRMVYFAKVNKVNSETVHKIPTDKLVNGILHLTVFDDKNRIIAERLCFVEPNDLSFSRPQIINKNLNYNPKGMNTFGISAEGKYVNYTTLISESSFPNSEYEESLLSTFYLTGDLISNISRPSQYFEGKNNSVALDALLISEKWTQFNWQNILNGIYPKIIREPKRYISYDGRVTLNSLPAKNKELNLLFKNGDLGTQINQVKTDDKGNFLLNDMIFLDTIKIKYSLNNVSESDIVNVIFQPNTEFTRLHKDLPETKWIVSPNSNENLSEESKRLVSQTNFNREYKGKEQLIEEVVIKANKRDLTEKLNKELSSSSFRAINETVFDFVNDYQNAAGLNILDWLQGRVAGLQIERRGGTSVPIIRNSEVKIFINEFQASADQLSMYSINDVAMLKVIKPPFQGGLSGGAIAIYLHNGKTSLNQRGDNIYNSSSLKFRNLIGYNKTESLPNIDYSVVERSSIENDSRVTLYYNPTLESTEENPATVRFFNNDSAKKFRVTIIGFDEKKHELIYFNDILNP